MRPRFEWVLDTRADHRDAVGMSEDTPNAALADPASPTSTTPDGVAEANARPPVNKLHEWGAAIAIMAFLTLIFLGFLFFFRELSL